MNDQPLQHHDFHGNGLTAARRRSRAFTLMELLVVVVIIAALAALIVSNVGDTTDDAELTAARATMQTIAEALTGSAAGAGLIGDLKYLPGFDPTGIRTHDLLSASRYPGAEPFDPLTQRGWRGAYVRNVSGVRNTNGSRNGAFPAGDERRMEGDATFLERGFFTDAVTSPYGVTGELAAADPWGNPIIVQVPPAGAFAGSTATAKRFRYARVVSAGADGALTTPPDRLAGLLADGTATVRGDDLVLFLNRVDAYETEEP